MSLLRGRVLEALALGAFIVTSAALPAAAQDSTGTTVKFVIPPIETHGFLEIYYRSGDPLVKDGYRLRKADLKFSGVLSPRLRWRILVRCGQSAHAQHHGRNEDGFRGVGRRLRRSAFSHAARRRVDVRRQPVRRLRRRPADRAAHEGEGTLNTWNIETIERANFEVERSRAVGLGDVRDIGASANGLAGGLEYHAGLFNEMGDAGGGTDATQAKAVLARLAYHFPILPGFHIGGTGGYETGLRSQQKSRAASEIQYRNSAFVIRGETMEARDGLLRRFGWYGLSAYRVLPNLQLVARFDSWDRDKGAENTLANALEQQITGGFSYFIEGGNAKLAVNVIRQTFPDISTVRDATIGLFAFQAIF